MREVENVQKVALEINLEDNYLSFDVACTLLNIFRRTDLSTKFAIKLFKSPRSHEFFHPAKKCVNTRS